LPHWPAAPSGAGSTDILSQQPHSFILGFSASARERSAASWVIHHPDTLALMRAATGDIPTKREGGIRRMAERFRHHGGPEGENGARLT
jgi:hypothetical protein